jgi:hypothetical protein
MADSLLTANPDSRLVRKVTEVKHVIGTLIALSVAAGILCICDLSLAADDGSPRVKEVKFSPERPETGDALKLRIALAGSAIRAEVKISKNDDEVETTLYDGISESVEIGNRFKAGDKVKAEVVPLDAGGLSGSSMVKAVEIANAPPSAKLLDQKITGNVYSARIESKDPEGDPISFSIQEGPPGLTVDEKGILNWRIGETTSGNFPIAVSIKDSHGAEVLLSYSIGLRREQGR